MQVLAMRFSQDLPVEPAPITIDGATLNTEPPCTTS